MVSLWRVLLYFIVSVLMGNGNRSCVVSIIDWVAIIGAASMQ